MTDSVPFHQDGSSIARVVLNIIKCHYPPISTQTVPKPVKAMIMGCWKKKPEERIQIKDAIEVLEKVRSTNHTIPLPCRDFIPIPCFR